MIRPATITQLPGSLRNLVNPVIDSVKISECDTIPDIINAARIYPLQLALIAQTNRGSIERYFLVGLALPSGKDKFKDPLFYYAPVLTTQYDRLRAFISRFQKNTSELWTNDQPIN